MKRILKAEIVVSRKDISEEEWRNFRRKGIGGSDAAAIVGLNPYTSAYSVWADKQSLTAEREDTEVMRIGRDLEGYVAERFCEIMKDRGEEKKIKNCNFILRHPKNIFMLANVDRLIVGENAGLECKTTSAYNKTDFEGSNIPDYYYVQCQHYMAVTGAEKWYLCVIVLGSGKPPYVFCIPRDEKEIAALIDAELYFWTEYIEKKKTPPVDGSESTADTINELYPDGREGTVMDLFAYEEDLNELNRVREEKKIIEDKESLLINKIKTVLGESEAGGTNNYSINWKNVISNRLDTAKIKDEMPNVYERFLKQSKTRKFVFDSIK